MHRTGAMTGWLKGWPFLHLTVIGYGVWQSRNLVEAWLHSPFDRWGWLAFLIWASPVLIGRGSSKASLVRSPCSRPMNPVGRVRPGEPLDVPGTRPTRLAGDRLALPSGSWDGRSPSAAAPLHSADLLLLVGLALAFLGDVGSFNVSRNAGLALMLLAFAPAPCRGFAMALSSLSWMPALGWFHQGYSPSSRLSPNATQQSVFYPTV